MDNMAGRAVDANPAAEGGLDNGLGHFEDKVDIVDGGESDMAWQPCRLGNARSTPDVGMEEFADIDAEARDGEAKEVEHSQNMQRTVAEEAVAMAILVLGQRKQNRIASGQESPLVVACEALLKVVAAPAQADLEAPAENVVD